MKKSLFSLMLLVATVTIHAQGWMPLGAGLAPQQNYYKKCVSTHYNGKLYVVERLNSSTPYTLRTSAWDGSSWTMLPFYTSSSYLGNPRAMQAYQGDLYVLVQGMMLRYNGSSWATVNIPGGSNYIDLAVVNNKLVVSGKFGAQGSNELAAEYDGTNWTVLPSLNPLISSNLYYGMEVTEHQGQLYLLSIQDSLSSIATNLFRLNSTTNAWEYAISYFSQPALSRLEFSGMLSNGQDLYVQGTNDNKMYVIENDSAKEVYSGTNYWYTEDYVHLNGKFYLAGHFMNGSINMAIFDGQNLSPLANVPANTQWGSAISTVATDGNLLYAAGNFTSLGSVTYNSVMASAGNFSTIAGNVYADFNNDCAKGSSEQGLGGALITVNPGGFTVSTNSNGDYAIGLSPGNYTLGPVDLTSNVHHNLSTTACMPGAISLGANQTAQQNIGAQFNTSGADLSISLSSTTAWRARFGFHTHYKIKVANTGDQNSAASTLDLSIPGGLQILTATPAPSSQSAGLATFGIPALNSLEEMYINFTIVIDTNLVNMGDTLPFIATTNLSDINAGNNSDTLIQHVVGAIDPNDKTASASSVVPGTDRLEYVIRFQNTGTDTAYTVTIRDTIDAELILGQLEMISASHAYEMRIKGETIEWVFNDILLPDSGVDMAGSQGYIHFAIGVDPTLALGAEINNDAEIYFDFQKPVHTNHAITVIEESTVGMGESYDAAEIQIFPNPTTEVLHIQNLSGAATEFVLYSMDGRLLLQVEVNAGEEVNISVGSLKAGVYLLKSAQRSYRILKQ